MRAGKPGCLIVDDQGNQCPTEDATIWSNHVEMHRTYPDDFPLERWLVKQGDELGPIKSAWKPFEHGPRNCGAQSPVMMIWR